MRGENVRTMEQEMLWSPGLKQTLVVVRDYWRDHGHPPSSRAVAGLLKRSDNFTWRALKRLEELGLIARCSTCETKGAPTMRLTFEGEAVLEEAPLLAMANDGPAGA